MKPFELPEDGNVIRLTYSEGITMLRAAGEEIEDYADMTYFSLHHPEPNSIRTPQEKFLGNLVKEKYHTDFCKIPLHRNLITRCTRQIPS